MTTFVLAYFSKLLYYNLPAVVKIGDGLLGVLLPLELYEDVPHQVVTQVVAHVHLLHLYININRSEKKKELSLVVSSVADSDPA
jgi:hypothetical protein